MRQNPEATGPNAIACYGKLLDAIPRGKRAQVFNEMCIVELVLREALRICFNVRLWILDSPTLGGEDSPFVQTIDDLLPRVKPAAAPTTPPEKAADGKQDS